MREFDMNRVLLESMAKKIMPQLIDWADWWEQGGDITFDESAPLIDIELFTSNNQ